MRFVRAMLYLSAAAPAAAQMPYSLAYVYTSMAETGDGRMSATVVANTYGSSGHTAAASVMLQRPDGHWVSANMYHDYMSQATTYVDLCSGSACWDGLYFASSQGTSEYCPIANQYMEPVQSQQDNQVQPFVRNQSVSFNPTSIARTGGTTTFRITVIKSLNCAATGVTVQMDLSSMTAPAPSYSYLPTMNGQAAAFGGVSTASASWEIRSSDTNQHPGTVAGTGSIISSSCRVDGQAGKEANPNLTIQ